MGANLLKTLLQKMSKNAQFIFFRLALQCHPILKLQPFETLQYDKTAKFIKCDTKNFSLTKPNGNCFVDFVKRVNENLFFFPKNLSFLAILMNQSLKG